MAIFDMLARKMATKTGNIISFITRRLFTGSSEVISAASITTEVQFSRWYINVVSVAQLVARRTHDRNVVGSIPTNAVCFTVVR